MCLAVPGKVVELWDTDTTRMAKVDFGGVLKEVSVAFVPDLQVGDYTIVHVGFALAAPGRTVRARHLEAVREPRRTRRRIR